MAILAMAKRSHGQNLGTNLLAMDHAKVKRWRLSNFAVAFMFLATNLVMANDLFTCCKIYLLDNNRICMITIGFCGLCGYYAYTMIFRIFCEPWAMEWFDYGLVVFLIQFWSFWYIICYFWWLV